MMFRLLVVCLAVSAVQALPATKWLSVLPRHGRFPANNLRQRILGGSLADRGELPFQAGIFLDGATFCGGSLLSPTIVLTSAHCAIGVRVFEVNLGALRPRDTTEQGRVIINSLDVKIHERFNGPSNDNDLALVRLPQSVDLTDQIQPIRLPSRGQASDYEGVTAVVSGWGLESDDSTQMSEDLLYTQVKVISNAECGRSFGSLITPTKLCVDTNRGQNAICEYDAGGPLTVTESDGTRTLIGAISFGSTNSCAANAPNVFSRLSEYLDWVAANGGPAVRP